MKEIVRLLRNPKVTRVARKGLPVDHILGQMDSVLHHQTLWLLITVGISVLELEAY